MDRRQFVQHGAALVGAAPFVRFNPVAGPVGKGELAPAASSMHQLRPPGPITEGEREERREKARRLMKSLGFSAQVREVPDARVGIAEGLVARADASLDYFDFCLAGLTNLRAAN